MLRYFIVGAYATLAILCTMSCVSLFNRTSTNKQHNMKVFVGVWHALDGVIPDKVSIDSCINCALKFDGKWYIQANKDQKCAVVYHRPGNPNTAVVEIEAIAPLSPEVYVECQRNDSKVPAHWVIKYRVPKTFDPDILTYDSEKMNYCIGTTDVGIYDKTGASVFLAICVGATLGKSVDNEIMEHEKPGNMLIFSDITIRSPDKVFTNSLSADTFFYREGCGFCK